MKTVRVIKETSTFKKFKPFKSFKTLSDPFDACEGMMFVG